MPTVRTPVATTHGVATFIDWLEVGFELRPSLEWIGRGCGAERFARVASALSTSGNPLPEGRYLASIAGERLPRLQQHLDLCLAVAALAAAGAVPADSVERWMLAGALGLDGKLHPTSGVLLLAEAAAAAGAQGIIVPAENAAEAAAVRGLEARSACTLNDVVRFLNGGGKLSRARTSEPAGVETGLDLSEVKGQEHVKRALEVAAAGAHNLLMIGPPGSGKTMLGARFPGILPPLSRTERFEASRVHSVAGTLRHGGLLQAPPFRVPHPSISAVGMFGGGSVPQPGEVSLAHRGVLFLDEFNDFGRKEIGALRQALENRAVTVTRSGDPITFPASFMLLAAMNPCACGHHGDPTRRCICAPRAVQAFLQRVPRPLLDRIDLHVEVPPVRYRELADRRPGEPSASIRARVERARAVQHARFRGRPDVLTNAEMGPADIREHCGVGDGADALLRTAITRLGLSSRAFHRVLKIARTIADLDGGGDITTAHVSEAIQYRSLDRAETLTTT